jgi:D-alanyl-D-alanine carboxypeptidase (penicillin-binding protein 5/6)
LVTAFAVFLVGTAGGAFSASPAEHAPGAPGDPLPLAARSAILVDEATGRVLYEHDADEPMVPASLAKLMTLHIVYQELEIHAINRSDVVSLSRNTWADHQAPGSTLMNLGPGQIVTVEELMKGVAIASGNDAAAALAEYVAGSSEAFVRRMNEEARFMGYSVMHFADPAGLSRENRVTAREFADFCRRYIELHPEALVELHSLREFDYPLPQNVPGGRLAQHVTHKQYNGNYLVWDGIGVDGLKTGHLDDANFTAAITARRGDTRLIAVMLGVPGHGLADGARVRTQDGLTLLTYGFRTYATMTLEPPALPPAHVWEGASRTLALVPAGPIRLTARKDELAALSYSILLQAPVVAPVLRGQKLGDIVYASGSGEVARVALLAASDMDRAGLLRRLWDGTLLGVSSALSGVAGALRSDARP